MTMQNKLDLIAAKAKEDAQLKFTSLVHLINVENLGQCYRELKRNKACGIDEMTVESYGENLDCRLNLLIEKMKAGHYYPQPVRRVYIPKAGTDEKRGLGIPTVEDKLVQLMLKKILESIYEADFLDCSNGFRPGRNCHQVVKTLDELVMSKPINYIVEVDIRKFFDNVQHSWLIRCMEERIKDPKIFGLIKRFVKSGVMDGGRYESTEQGTPQGGVISPLLANIYLHYVLDLWFEKKVKPQAKGVMKLVRYCDDFVVCCESEADATRFLCELKQRLMKFGLSIAEEKTRIVRFGKRTWQLLEKQGKKAESFNFLGFTHYARKSRRGKWMMGHKTSKENLARKLKETNQWLKVIRNSISLKDWWVILRAKLTGHFNYFGISGNYRGINQFRDRVVSLVYKWINRRSQKKSMTWEKFSLYRQRYPLPEARICYSLYQFT